MINAKIGIGAVLGAIMRFPAPLERHSPINFLKFVFYITIGVIWSPKIHIKTLLDFCPQIAHFGR